MSTKKKTITYYAIAGLNAYGVFTDSSKAENATNYIFAHKAKKFKDFEEAKDWATDRFYHLQPPYETFAGIEPITKVNWCYHRKKY